MYMTEEWEHFNEKDERGGKLVDWESFWVDVEWICTNAIQFSCLFQSYPTANFPALHAFPEWKFLLEFKVYDWRGLFLLLCPWLGHINGKDIDRESVSDDPERRTGIFGPIIFGDY